MLALRALNRWAAVMAGVVALTFAAPFAGFGSPAGGASTPAAEGSIPALAGTVPAVGGSIGDVITTTCGNSAVIVLSVIVCEA